METQQLTCPTYEDKRLFYEREAERMIEKLTERLRNNIQEERYGKE